jgi:hypothetical protein
MFDHVGAKVTLGPCRVEFPPRNRPALRNPSSALSGRQVPITDPQSRHLLTLA